MGDHPPDWARFGIDPPNTFQKVGDPTRWGAQDSTILPGPISGANSGQILQIVTRDLYARPWSLLGVLSMPVSVIAEPQVEAILQVTMGVGQVQILQEIVMYRGSGAAGTRGLCFDQQDLNGGPYTGVNFFANNVAGVSLAYTPMPFAIVGGLLGQTVSIRARYTILSANVDVPAPMFLAAIVTPYAAGQNL